VCDTNIESSQSVSQSVSPLDDGSANM